MREGRDCHIGHCSEIAEDVVLGDHVIIGNNVTVYPGVRVGRQSRIMDGAVIGRLTYATSSVSRAAPNDYCELQIGPRSVIGCHVVLYTGVTLGADTLLADGVSIREGCQLGDGVFLGRYVTLNYDSQIGTRSKIMDFSHITGVANFGEDCFLGTHVSTGNDNQIYLRRFGLDNSEVELQGPQVGHYVVIGNNATLNPGVHIGDGAQIASGAVVTRSIPAWSMALGVPAHVARLVEASAMLKIRELATQRGQVIADYAPDPVAQPATLQDDPR